MIELKTNELKNIQLEITEYLDSVCRKNNINYTLLGGTLIGAIRHKGYIPWDDDIDIAFSKSEFKKFLNIVNSTDSNYKLLTLETTKDYFYPFAKLVDKRTTLVENSMPKIKELGVNIDVFVLETFPSNKNEHWEFIKKSHQIYSHLIDSRHRYCFYDGVNKFVSITKQTLKTPVYLYCKIKSLDYWKKEMRNAINSFDTENSQYIGFPTTEYYEKDVFDKSIFENFIDVEFEGKSFKAIKEYDKYLTQVYGNYMEFPPKEERISHHYFKAYRNN